MPRDRLIQLLARYLAVAMFALAAKLGFECRGPGIEGGVELLAAVVAGLALTALDHRLHRSRKRKTHHGDTETRRNESR